MDYSSSNFGYGLAEMGQVLVPLAEEAHPQWHLGRFTVDLGLLRPNQPDDRSAPLLSTNSLPPLPKSTGRLQTSAFSHLTTAACTSTLDKKPKDHGISSYSRSSERSEYQLDNAIHISFDRHGKDRDEKGREVGRGVRREDRQREDRSRPCDSVLHSRRWSLRSTSVNPRSSSTSDEDEFSYGIYDRTTSATSVGR